MKVYVEFKAKILLAIFMLIFFNSNSLFCFNDILYKSLEEVSTSCKVLFYLNLNKLDYVNKDNENLLHLAGRSNNKFLIKKLIKKGFNLDDIDSNGETILIKAVKDNNKKLIKLLLNYDISINFQDRFGFTALHWAVLSKDLNIVHLLLDKSPHLELSNVFGETALMLAVKDNCYDISKILLKKGASPDNYDDFFKTNLYYSCKYGNHKLSKLLLSYNASVCRVNFDFISILISCNHCKMLKLILDYQFPVSIEYNLDRRIAHLICKYKRIDIANLLLSYKNSNISYNDDSLQNIMLNNGEVYESLLDFVKVKDKSNNIACPIYRYDIFNRQ